MPSYLNPDARNHPSADLIKDSSTANFAQDVIEASQTTPVLVDFHAPWCGPCKQLGPAIEKVVTEAQGQVKLVKIDIDRNQAISSQMGIKSIPAVIAFAGGRPVDGFAGAISEAEIRDFVKRVIDSAPVGPKSRAAQIAKALEQAQAAVDAGDLGEATNIYGAISQADPDNDAAIVGIAAIRHEIGDSVAAGQMLQSVSDEGKNLASYIKLATALKLEREAASLGDIGELEADIARAPDDHQARFDLALAQNVEGNRIAAVSHLVEIVRRERAWNDDAARKKLLELFDAWGPADEATVKGRRLLSGTLFS